MPIVTGPVVRDSPESCSACANALIYQRSSFSHVEHTAWANPSDQCATARVGMEPSISSESVKPIDWSEPTIPWEHLFSRDPNMLRSLTPSGCWTTARNNNRSRALTETGTSSGSTVTIPPSVIDSDGLDESEHAVNSKIVASRIKIALSLVEYNNILLERAPIIISILTWFIQDSAP